MKLVDYINYKHFANMKGTIYENRLPRGYASEERLGTTVLDHFSLPVFEHMAFPFPILVYLLEPYDFLQSSAEFWNQ